MPAGSDGKRSLKVCTPADPAMPAEALGLHDCRPGLTPERWACVRQAGEETVSRFRPLARRRFRTSRPFFVLMRTKKPCVRRRRRRFGWNVRFMIADPLVASRKWLRNLDSSEGYRKVSMSLAPFGELRTPSACRRAEPRARSTPAF
jgi:hypothetical protein